MTTKHRLYVYKTGPLDDWAGWREIVVPEGASLVRGELTRSFDEADIEDEYLRAVLAFINHNEEGEDCELRQNPHVTIHPSEDNLLSAIYNGGGTSYVFGFKLSNNGTTYFVTKHRLHLFDMDPFIDKPKIAEIHSVTQS